METAIIVNLIGIVMTDEKKERKERRRLTIQSSMWPIYLGGILSP